MCTPDGTLKIIVPKTLSLKLHDSFVPMTWIGVAEGYFTGIDAPFPATLQYQNGTLRIVVSEKQRTERTWREWSDAVTIALIVLDSVGVIVTLILFGVTLYFW